MQKRYIGEKMEKHEESKPYNPWVSLKEFIKHSTVFLILCECCEIDDLISLVFPRYPYVLLLQDIDGKKIQLDFAEQKIEVFHFNRQDKNWTATVGKSHTNPHIYCGVLCLWEQGKAAHNLDTIRKLSSYIPQGYFFRNLYYMKQFYVIPIYGQKKQYAKNRKRCIVLPDEGYGDTFFTLPFWDYYVKKSQQQGWHIVFHHTSHKSFYIYQIFLPTCHHIFEPLHRENRKLSQIIQTVQPKLYADVKDVTYESMVRPPMFNGYDKIKLLCYLLDFPYDPPNYLCVSTISVPVSKIPPEFLAFRATKKHMIGIHFHTEHDTQDIRNWPEHYVEQLIDLCQQENIGIVNFSRQFKARPTVLDLSHYTITKLIPIVAELDEMVGIDSCFCHIAGALGVDNITIWGGSNPFYSFLYRTKICARPFQSNFSIASYIGDIKRIMPDVVFTVLYGLLHKEYSTTSHYLPYGHEAMGEAILWVDDEWETKDCKSLRRNGD